MFIFVLNSFTASNTNVVTCIVSAVKEIRRLLTSLKGKYWNWASTLEGSTYVALRG